MGFRRLLPIIFTLAACGDPDETPPVDARLPPVASTDAGALDAATTDAGSSDEGPLDARVTDAGPMDAGLVDAGLVDAGLVDAGSGPACAATLGAVTACAVPGFEERPLTVYAPPAPTTAIPVVIAFHGGGGNSNAGAQSTCPNGDLRDPECLHSVGVQEGFITVYPNGTLSPLAPGARIWNAGGGEDGWACVGFCREDIDEAGYLETIIDTLAAALPIDRDRVYAVGLSNGGAVVHRLACEQTDRLAAIASIGAANQYATSAPCQPSRPIPVLQIHGTEDGCWPYEGGPITCQNPNNTAPTISAAASLEQWRVQNGCDPNPTTGPGPERVDDGIQVEIDRWTGCLAPVEHFRVIGGGHTWLGGRQYLPVEVIGPSYPDVSNKDIWDFFAPHRR